MTGSVKTALRRHQQGLTLVELMIAVAINLVVVLAAAYLYLNGRQTQRAVEERSAIFENGQLALELIGKDIGNAGYYPAHMHEPGATLLVNIGSYVNPAPLVAAFNAGVFGCSNGRFQNGACVDADGTVYKHDGLVLNYYTDDGLTLAAGARADCQGSRVDNDAVINQPRAGAAWNSANLPPEAPLFVSNRYTLREMAYAVDGGQRTIKTFGLACLGNGSATYQVLVPGIEQLRVRYGLRDASAPRASQYVDAAAANNAVGVVVNDQTLSAWQRVVSVQVCVVARSLTETRFKGAGDDARTDCDGQAFPTDGVQRRRFLQVFAVKNRLS
jgi:type IV pilus assembly protein PilW